MFIIKTVKIPKIFREEKYTRRGRKYYGKKSIGKRMAIIIRFLAVLYLALYGLRLMGDGKETTLFEDSFQIEEGAYTQGLFDGEAEKIVFESKKAGDGPLILIFHTHGSEEYGETKENGQAYSVKDAGNVLAEMLAEKYGVTVVHDVSEYDAEGTEGSYERSGEGVGRLLEKYPSVRVLVDIHRDAYKAGDDAAEINGKRYARFMPVVGVCGIDENGEKKGVGLENEFIDENMKFAYNFRENCGEDICKKIYIKPYRYSTYMMPESILLEAGNEKSTFEEVENSMEIVAKAIVKSAGIK